MTTNPNPGPNPNPNPGPDLDAQDAIMATAERILDELSADPEICRLAQRRSDELKLDQMELAARKAEGRIEGKAEGKIEGKAEGRIEVLLELLTLRFGGLSDATRAQLETASAEQFDSWIERVLTAETLDRVLVP